MNAPKDLVVKYRNGRYPYRKFGGSAAAVTQVLDKLAAELRAFAGDYAWSLDGDTFRGYAIVARYSGGSFTESTGKTPGIALRGFNAAKVVLRNGYKGDWS